MKARCFVFCLSALASPAWAADVAGTLQWSQRVDLSTPVSGTVRTVAVDIGDRVKKGQTLLSLDATAYSAGVNESQAAIARAKEEELDSKRNLDRTQELYNRTVISTSELEAAQTRHARAKALLAEKQAQLARSRQALGDATLRAPFDALVLARHVEPGQTVASGLAPQPLLTVAKAGEMIARAHVSLAQIEKLKPGDPVIVAVGTQSYNGKIKTLGLEPVADKSGAGYVVDVLLPIRDMLRAGTPVTLRLP